MVYVKAHWTESSRQQSATSSQRPAEIKAGGPEYLEALAEQKETGCPRMSNTQETTALVAAGAGGQALERPGQTARDKPQGLPRDSLPPDLTAQPAHPPPCLLTAGRSKALLQDQGDP